MSSRFPRDAHATLADLLAIPEAKRFHEIVDGKLVRKATPSARQAAAKAGMVERLGVAYGTGRRSGWLFATDAEIHFDDLRIAEALRGNS